MFSLTPIYTSSLNNDYNKEQIHAMFTVLNLLFVVANPSTRHGKLVPSQ